MVIDLTPTDKYYQSKDLHESVTLKKIRIRGQEVPKEEVVTEFIELVDRFWAENPQSYVAIHCTHGHNRTGYMVVRYLMARHQLSSEDAIKAFAAARPPGIYREIYLEALLALDNASASARPPVHQLCGPPFEEKKKQKTNPKGFSRKSKPKRNDGASKGAPERDQLREKKNIRPESSHRRPRPKKDHATSQDSTTQSDANPPQES